MNRLLALGCLTLTIGCSIPEQGVARGEVRFDGCTQCHGSQGEGSKLAGAPAIAGLPGWYVENQLYKFRNGVRGAHPDDVEGLRMRPMSRMLRDDNEVKAVAEYVASLPPHSPGATLAEADAKAGAALYATCSACHGADGAGNEALKAPPLKQLDDWYVVAQLQKFKSGVRGTNPNDIEGAQMRPMSMILADDTAIRNVAAHIQTLK